MLKSIMVEPIKYTNNFNVVSFKCVLINYFMNKSTEHATPPLMSIKGGVVCFTLR
jgi:hypothetical protein